jgi:hypothetical protein
MRAAVTATLEHQTNTFNPTEPGGTAVVGRKAGFADVGAKQDKRTPNLIPDTHPGPKLHFHKRYFQDGKGKEDTNLTEAPGGLHHVQHNPLVSSPR